MRSCPWCRSKLQGATGYLPFGLVHRVRSEHNKNYAMQVAGAAPIDSGNIEVCEGCAKVVEEAIYKAYLERRKAVPENVVQLEALEVDLEEQRLATAAREAELEATRRQLAAAEQELAAHRQTIRSTQKLLGSLSGNLELPTPPTIEGELEYGHEDG